MTLSRSGARWVGVALIVAASVSVVAFWHARREHDRILGLLRALPKEGKVAPNPAVASDSAEPAKAEPVAVLDVEAEVKRARDEIAELERKAAADRDEARARQRQRTEALHANRDLAAGPVLIEHCANVGRDTPEATLQTLIWAAAQGQDATVRDILRFDAESRRLAEEAISRLPEASRQQYPNPEALGALFVAQVVNDITGIRMLERNVDNDTATINFAGLQKPIGKVNLHKGERGWQVVIDPAVFERIRRMLLTPRK